MRTIREEAQQSYESGDYATAAYKYQRVLDEARYYSWLMHTDVTREAEQRLLNIRANANGEQSNRIGEMYAHFDDINPPNIRVYMNYKEAKRWFERSRNQRFSRGYHNSGRIYEEGLGGARDFSRAAEYYQIALALGGLDTAESQAALTRIRSSQAITAKELVEIGQKYIPRAGLASNITPNYMEGIMWFRVARHRKFSSACDALGEVYYSDGIVDGLVQIQRDFVLAAGYYQEAIDRRLFTSQDRLTGFSLNLM